MSSWIGPSKSTLWSWCWSLSMAETFNGLAKILPDPANSSQTPHLTPIFILLFYVVSRWPRVWVTPRCCRWTFIVAEQRLFRELHGPRQRVIAHDKLQLSRIYDGLLSLKHVTQITRWSVWSIGWARAQLRNILSPFQRADWHSDCPRMDSRKMSPGWRQTPGL
jgi:hypothetical protein